jgi:spore germination protein KA
MWFHSDAHKKIIHELKGKNSDITTRMMKCGRETITILFVKQLTNRESLSNFVIKPLVEYCGSARKPVKAEEAIDSILYVDDCTLEEDAGMIERHILNGMTVLLFSNDRKYITANLKKVEHRNVREPMFQYTVRGPKDCFVENLDINLSLLRYRLKDRNLRVEYLTAGERTRTRIAMVYIEDIANDTCVQEIRKRVEQIDADGFVESGEVQAFLLNSRTSLFPNMILTERSDMVSEQVLEGKVLLIVEGSNQVLAAPTTFVEFMYACDDRYDNKFFGFFMRMIRYIAFFVSFASSSYWVAMVSFHSDILPASFIIMLAEARSKVPFNALTGALLLEFIMELMRETMIRVPEKVGPAIGIVSAIIIGQAAIAAGVFSPLLLILISVEFLASFAIPNITISNPFRLVKLLLLLITGMFGFYGFILGITVVVVELVSINSFGTPYLAPFGPFNLYDFLRTFMFSRTFSPKRQQYMRTKDDTRTGKK